MKHESPNGETNDEMKFILAKKLNTVKNMAVLGKLKSNEHRMMKCKITLNFKREREKLFRMWKPSISTVKEKWDEFIIRIQNMYSQIYLPYCKIVKWFVRL